MWTVLKFQKNLEFLPRNLVGWFKTYQVIIYLVFHRSSTSHHVTHHIPHTAPHTTPHRTPHHTTHQTKHTTPHTTNREYLSKKSHLVGRVGFPRALHPIAGEAQVSNPTYVVGYFSCWHVGTIGSTVRLFKCTGTGKGERLKFIESRKFAPFLG